jgi:hypothetical protein
MSYTAGRTITLTVLSALDASGRICINTTQATDLSIAMTARATPGTSLDMQVPTRFANTTR